MEQGLYKQYNSAFNGIGNHETPDFVSIWVSAMFQQSLLLNNFVKTKSIIERG